MDLDRTLLPNTSNPRRDLPCPASAFEPAEPPRFYEMLSAASRRRLLRASRFRVSTVTIRTLRPIQSVGSRPRVSSTLHELPKKHAPSVRPTVLRAGDPPFVLIPFHKAPKSLASRSEPTRRIGRPTVRLSRPLASSFRRSLERSGSRATPWGLVASTQSLEHGLRRAHAQRGRLSPTCQARQPCLRRADSPDRAIRPRVPGTTTTHPQSSEELPSVRWVRRPSSRAMGRPSSYQCWRRDQPRGTTLTTNLKLRIRSTETPPHRSLEAAERSRHTPLT